MEKTALSQDYLYDFLLKIMGDYRNCGNCKHCHEGHYEDPGEPPYIKRKCMNKYGLTKNYSVQENDFCSRWEKKETG